MNKSNSLNYMEDRYTLIVIVLTTTDQLDSSRRYAVTPTRHLLVKRYSLLEEGTLSIKLNLIYD